MLYCFYSKYVHIHMMLRISQIYGICSEFNVVLYVINLRNVTITFFLVFLLKNKVCLFIFIFPLYSLENLYSLLCKVLRNLFQFIVQISYFIWLLYMAPYFVFQLFIICILEILICLFFFNSAMLLGRLVLIGFLVISFGFPKLKIMSTINIYFSSFEYKHIFLKLCFPE